jgi:hypothetical protein
MHYKPLTLSEEERAARQESMLTGRCIRNAREVAKKYENVLTEYGKGDRVGHRCAGELDYYGSGSDKTGSGSDAATADVGSGSTAYTGEKYVPSSGEQAAFDLLSSGGYSKVYTEFESIDMSLDELSQMEHTLDFPFLFHSTSLGLDIRARMGEVTYEQQNGKSVRVYHVKYYDDREIKTEKCYESSYKTKYNEIAHRNLPQNAENPCGMWHAGWPMEVETRQLTYRHTAWMVPDGRRLL